MDTPIPEEKLIVFPLGIIERDSEDECDRIQEMCEDPLSIPGDASSKGRDASNSADTELLVDSTLGEIDVCIICLQYFSQPGQTDQQQLNDSEIAFLTVCKNLNIPKSTYSKQWDFSKDLIPICDTCYSIVHKLIELETELTKIQTEIRSQVLSIENRIVGDSKKYGDEPLTDKRLRKWRGMAVKVAKRSTTSFKSPIVEDRTAKRKQVGKEKVLNISKQKPKKRSVTPELLDVKPIISFIVPYPGDVNADNGSNSDMGLPNEIGDQSPPPSPTYSSSDPDWEVLAAKEKPQNAAKRKRPERQASKVKKIKVDEDWAPENEQQSGPERDDDDDSERGSSSTDDISFSELSDLEDNGNNATPAKKKKKKYSYSNENRKSFKRRPSKSKWKYDKKRNIMLYRHIETTWLEGGEGLFRIKCLQCEHIVEGDNAKYTKDYIKKHIILDHLGTFTCTYAGCGRKFGRRLDLTRHTEGFHEHKLWECNICGKPVPHQSGKRHLTSHMNRQEKVEYYANRRIGKRTLENHVCDQCGLSCKSADTLRQHQKTHSDLKTRLQHMCTACGKLFVNNSGLNYHVARVHEKETLDTSLWFQCPECPLKFFRRRSLKLHMPKHSDERNFECKICGKAFKVRTALLVHEKTVHSTERPYPCSYCDKSFKRGHHLRVHLKAYHPGGQSLPQRPQNRLKGPAGKDGNPNQVRAVGHPY